ncbi:hypothetical protein [Clostridium sp.]|uniref:hypothetical protein n=1 Tax=Clostridium sp. TaxID=1506 RepID=UPI003D6CC840
MQILGYKVGQEVFGERMFRYFYRIWDKFRYKNNDESEIVGAVIYSYKGERGKDKRLVDFLEYLFLVKDPELEKKYEEYKKKNGGAFKLSIDKIRKSNYMKEGREEGIAKEESDNT